MKARGSATLLPLMTVITKGIFGEIQVMKGLNLEGLVKMVKEKEVIEKMTQVEEDDECHSPDLRDQQFVLLLRVTQANDRLLPTGGFTSRAMIQMICDIMGVIPKEADILTDQEVVLEIEDQSSIYRGVQGNTRVISLGRSSNYSG